MANVIASGQMPDTCDCFTRFQIINSVIRVVRHLYNAYMLNPVIALFHMRAHPALVTKQYMPSTLQLALEILHVELSSNFVASAFRALRSKLQKEFYSPYCCESSQNKRHKIAPLGWEALLSCRRLRIDDMTGVLVLCTSRIPLSYRRKAKTPRRRGSRYVQIVRFSSLPSWRSSAKHELIIHFVGPFSNVFTS